MRLRVVFSVVEEIWVVVWANVGLASETVIGETEEVVVLSSFGPGIVSEVTENVRGERHSEMSSRYIWSV